MKTLKIIIISLIVINYFSPVYSQEDAQLVSTQVAKIEQVRAVTWLPGNVVNRLDAAISAEQSGQLLYIVEMGSQVDKGTVIAKLDDRALNLELSQFEAQLRQIKANVDYLKAQQTRMEKLVENYSTSVSEIDRNRRDLRVAKEQQAAMEIQIQRTKLALDQTQIKAPFNGTVNAHFVNLGELISVNTPLMQLVDTQHLDITVATPLNLSSYVTKVKHVQVKWGDQLHNLPIRNWSSAGNQASRTFDLRVDASGIDLFAGSAVLVSLPKSEETVGVTIPRDGLILRDKESYVFKVDEEKVAHKVNVDIGLGIDDWVVVNGDIRAGDQIIVRGGERLEDGQAVRINNAIVDLIQNSSLEGLADAG